MKFTMEVQVEDVIESLVASYHQESLYLLFNQLWLECETMYGKGTMKKNTPNFLGAFKDDILKEEK
jgi:hypothetical protein